MKPMYKKNKINSDVSRASHTHQAPHIGLPHKAPVHSDKNANSAPVGARAWLSMPAIRARNTKHTTPQKAMAK